MAEVGKVTYKIVGDNTEFKSDVKKSSEIAIGVAREIGAAFIRAGQQAGKALIDAAKIGLQYNATMETLTTNFTTLLSGNANAASNLVNEIKELAKVTPLATAGLAANAQTLMGYGIASDTVIDTLTMLGDAAMGDQTKLDSLTLAYSQVMAAGQLRGQEALQMINAGIPIYELLGRSMGITAAEAKALGDAGKISAEQVTEAFRSASAEGGMYAGAMEKTAKTFTGLLSTLKDEANEALGEITNGLFKIAKNDVLPTLSGYLMQLSDAFSTGGFEKLSEKLGAVLGDAVGKISQALPKIMQGAATLVNGFVRGIVDNMPTIVNGILGMAPVLVDGIMQLLPALIEGVGSLVISVAEALPGIVVSIVQAIVDSLPQIIQALITLAIAVVGALPTIVQAIVDAIPILIEFLVQVVTDNLPIIIEGLIQLVAAIVAALPQIIVALVNAVPSIVMAIINGFMALANSFVDIGQKLVLWTAEGILGLWNYLVGKVSDGVTVLKDSVKKGFSEFVNIGKNIVTGIWDGIRGGWDWLVSSVSSLARSLLDGAKRALGIRSPSKAFRDEFGEMIDKGAAEGITENADVPVKAVRDMGKSLLSSLPSLGVEQSISRTFAVSAANATPVFNINLTGALEADGMNLANFLLRNLDDAAAFTVRG